MKNKRLTTMSIKDILKYENDGSLNSDISIQREIVFDSEKQSKVIDSIMQDIPLGGNLIIWDNTKITEGKKGKYEILDGRQRTTSIKAFYNNQIEWDGATFKDLDQDEQDKFLNEEIPITILSGDEKYKREVFYRINTLGVPLNDYEVLNGLYNGTYLTELNEYIKNEKSITRIYGSNSRGKINLKLLQQLVTPPNNKTIADYVEKNQKNSFETDKKRIHKEIKFLDAVFTDFKDLNMLWDIARNNKQAVTIWKQKALELNKWKIEYAKSDSYKLDKDKLQTYKDGFAAIIGDIEIDKQRLFSETQKEEVIERDGNSCKDCGAELSRTEMSFDHKKPWSKGGRTIISNCQILCKTCNSKKGNN